MNKATEPKTPDTARPRRGFLARLRIRKKLLVLHTVFSLSMTLILLVALRPALDRVVTRAEREEAVHALEIALAWAPVGLDQGEDMETRFDTLSVRRGVDPRAVAPEWVERARTSGGRAVAIVDRSSPGLAIAWTQREGRGELWVVESTLGQARREVFWVYGYTIGALLVVYALIAGALELFILPRHVYQPIASLLRADRALREGDSAAEIVREEDMPADELGEIMRSRNSSIRKIRHHESALADALGRIELVATDLRRKNHMLENARRNLADADRLVSLGMMAAGIAHELNTPLAVAKGLAEKLNQDSEPGLSPTEIALLCRVVGRIERLSESLLDFARVRPPTYVTSNLREIVEDALTLTRLERGTPGVEIIDRVPENLTLQADADRLVQVMVNLIRNAMDAMSQSPGGGQVVIDAQRVERDGQGWVLLTVTDDGSGIDPEVLGHLFEPFVSRRLDDRGTGLGLAVSEGIVHEHGGTILASNRVECSGAVFEVMLPVSLPLSEHEPKPES
jgi:two-component system, NtrC family, sensor kinase